MKFLLSLAVAGLLALAPMRASATVVIKDSPGGKITDFVRQYEDLRYSGEHVVVDGFCASACTLLLGILPKQQFCATATARFGFHTATAVWEDDDGVMHSEHATEFTELMWALYPQNIRRVVKRLGWDGDNPEKPHPDVVWVKGKALHAIAPICTAGDLK
jgi:ATP-dependent protease ClpP protease subunit